MAADPSKLSDRALRAWCVKKVQETGERRGGFPDAIVRMLAEECFKDVRAGKLPEMMASFGVSDAPIVGDKMIFPVEWGPQLPSIPEGAQNDINALVGADIGLAYDLLRHAVMNLRKKQFAVASIACTGAAVVAGHHLETEPVAAKKLIYASLVISAIAGNRKIPRIKQEAKRLAFFGKMSGRIQRALRIKALAGLGALPEPVISVARQLDKAETALMTGQLPDAEEHAIKALERAYELRHQFPLISKNLMQEAREIITEVHSQPGYGVRHLIPERLFEPGAAPTMPESMI